MSIEVIRSATDEQMALARHVVLPTDAIDKLTGAEIDLLKMRVALCQEAAATAGQALAATAEHLYEIKKLAKKGRQWKALLRDGLLGVSENNAERLVLTYEKGLFKQVPASCVANVSITTLYLVANCKDVAKQNKAIVELTQAAGTGYTERSARKTLSGTRRSAAAKTGIESAIPKGVKAQVVTKMARPALMAEVTQLRKENAELKTKLKEAGVSA